MARLRLLRPLLLASVLLSALPAALGQDPAAAAAPGAPAQQAPPAQQQQAAPAAPGAAPQQQAAAPTSAEERLAKLRDDLAKLQHDFSSAKSEADKVRGELGGKQAALETKHKELEGAYYQLGEKDKLLGQKDQQLGEKDKEISSLRGTIDGKEKELTEARTKVAALMVVQNDLMKEKENLHLTYQELRAKYENPELQHYITTRAAQLMQNNPTLQGAVNKTSTLLLPASEKYTLLLNNTHHAIKSSIHPILGEHSHLVSGVVSYAIFLLPIIGSLYCFVSVRALFNLRVLLSVFNLYLCLCGLVSAFFTLYLRGDPIAFMQESSGGTYIMTQLMFGMLYVGYLSLHAQALYHARFSAGLRSAKFVQLLAASVVGVVYYISIFSPAMQDKPPLTNHTWPRLFLIYALAGSVFASMIYVDRVNAAEGIGAKGGEYGRMDEMEIMLSSAGEPIKVRSAMSEDEEFGLKQG